MNLIEQIEKDKSFGHEIMKAANIRVVEEGPFDGLQLSIMCWFSHGEQVGPVFAYFGNELNIKLIWPYKIKEPRIFQATLKKALPIIKKSDHTGQVTLRTFIARRDEKSYGIRWHTSINKEIIQTMATLLKITFSEWAEKLQNGIELEDEFHFKYAGSVVTQLNDTNSQLILFRLLGYELPFNQDAMGLSDHEPDHSHQ